MYIVLNVDNGKRRYNMLIKYTDWVPYGDTQVPYITYECDEDYTTCDCPKECSMTKKCEDCEEYYCNRAKECPYCGDDNDE